MQTKKEKRERERERLRGSVYVWEDKVSDENRKREREIGYVAKSVFEREKEMNRSGNEKRGRNF